MIQQAVKSPEATAEQVAEYGTAAAVLALIMAAGRAITTAIAGPWPEIFVGPIGAVWWGMFGAAIAVAVYCGIRAAVMMCRGEP